MAVLRIIRNISLIVIPIMAALGLIGFLVGSIGHISDTNGRYNYAIQCIDEEDIVGGTYNSRGKVSQKDASFEGIHLGTKYSSKKFTGVQKIYSATVPKGSKINVALISYKVHAGNFSFLVAIDGKIAGDVRSDHSGTAFFYLDNPEKDVQVDYYIVGESANFSFITETESK